MKIKLKNSVINGLIVLLTGFFNLNAQIFPKENANWQCAISTLGIQRALAIDLNTNKPIFNGFLNHNYEEAIAVQSDTNGALLFYTNGDTIFNKYHKSMGNGTGLIGCNSSQSMLILRQPGSFRYFYVFTLDQSDGKCNNMSKNRGIYYHVVDMQGMAGSGYVISKNNFLMANSGERIASTIHHNKKDLWILLKENYTNKISIYLLTATGIKFSHKENSFKDTLMSTGEMKFSPDGKWLYISRIRSEPFADTIVLYKFDNQIGTISPQSSFANYHKRAYSADFSPNSKLLYFNCEYNKIPTLFQLNLRQFVNSKSVIPSFSIKTNTRDIRLALNQKIYICSYDSFLYSFDSPNELGLNCLFNSNSFLPPNHPMMTIDGIEYGFSNILNFPDFPSPSLLPNIQYHSSCKNIYSFYFDKTIYDSITWIFEDTAVTCVADTFDFTNYEYNGAKKIMAIGHFLTIHDTLNSVVLFNLLPNINLGNDTVLTKSEKLNYDFSSNPQLDSFHWLTSSLKVINSPKVSINIQGNYKFFYYSRGCEFVDSVYVYKIDSSVRVKFSCKTDSLLLKFNYVADSIFIKINGTWSFQNNKEIKILRKQDTTLFSELWKFATASKILNDTFTFSDLNSSFLPIDTLIQLNRPISIVPNNSKYKYLWQTKYGQVLSQFSTWNVSDSGIILVSVSNDYCIDSFYIQINIENLLIYVYIPTAFSPNFDNLNDVWKPYGKNIKVFKITIFNRWGEKIFDGKPNEPFDAKYHNTIIQAGVYPAIVSITDEMNHKSYFHISLNILR
jgi:gliding motility-associated-like protein